MLFTSWPDHLAQPANLKDCEGMYWKKAVPHLKFCLHSLGICNPFLLTLKSASVSTTETIASKHISPVLISQIGSCSASQSRIPGSPGCHLLKSPKFARTGVNACPSTPAHRTPIRCAVLVTSRTRSLGGLARLSRPLSNSFRGTTAGRTGPRMALGPAYLGSVSLSLARCTRGH